MDRDMNIQKCRAFLATVECGSFTKAAEKLAYSQSGVSRMIADLEREWGVALLERDRQGVRLTSEGSEMLPFARGLCDEYDRLQAQVDSMKGLESGIIRIGTFSSVAEHWLPQVIKRFHEDYPGIDYELLMGDYAEIEAWLLEGRVDCGFLKLPVAEGLNAEVLEEDELMAVLPAGHPLARKKTVSLKDLCGDPFMMLERGANTEVADAFAAAGLKPEVKFTTWDDYAIMAMVENDMGVGVLHHLILQGTNRRIVVRPLAKPLYRRIALCTPTGKPLSLAAKRFLDYLPYREA